MGQVRNQSCSNFTKGRLESSTTILFIDCKYKNLLGSFVIGNIQPMSVSKERLLQISNNNAHCPATHEYIEYVCMHVHVLEQSYINIDRSLQTFFWTDRLDPEV